MVFAERSPGRIKVRKAAYVLVILMVGLGGLEPPTSPLSGAFMVLYAELLHNLGRAFGSRPNAGQFRKRIGGRACFPSKCSSRATRECADSHRRPEWEMWNKAVQ